MSDDSAELNEVADAVAEILAQELLKILDNSVIQAKWLGLDPSLWARSSAG